MISEGIKISKLENNDYSLEQLSILHKNLFDKEHFTSLFNKDLLKTYYQLLINESDYSYKAELDGKIVGYLIAGSNLNESIKKFSRKYLKELLFVLVINPKFLFEKIYNLISKLVTGNKKSEAKMRLFIIASEHNQEIKGIGKRLIEAFEEDLRADKISLYGLSVRKHNKRAINFYYYMGFTEEFVTNKSIYFIKYLNQK